MSDLIVLVADIDAEFAIRGLLARPDALGIRPIGFDIFRHPNRDPGCLHQSCIFLRPFMNRYQHALVVFDHEGCGREASSPPDIEADLEGQMAATGWQQRAAVVVIQPELEQWVWSDSPNVADALGWRGRTPNLREWLEAHHWASPESAKPQRPKEAMRAAMRLVQKVPSASVFRQLAETVSFRRCTDPSFTRLLSRLRLWFQHA